MFSKSHSAPGRYRRRILSESGDLGRIEVHEKPFGHDERGSLGRTHSGEDLRTCVGTRQIESNSLDGAPWMLVGEGLVLELDQPWQIDFDPPHVGGKGEAVRASIETGG